MFSSVVVLPLLLTSLTSTYGPALVAAQDQQPAGAAAQASPAAPLIENTFDENRVQNIQPVESPAPAVLFERLRHNAAKHLRRHQVRAEKEEGKKTAKKVKKPVKKPQKPLKKKPSPSPPRKKPTTTAKHSQPTAATGAGKRGLSYNDPHLTKPFGPAANSASQVSWTYNWYSYPCGSPSSNCGYNQNLAYIPTLWSNDSALTSVWNTAATAAIANGSSALFSFNEPDLCVGGSACMTVASAVRTWKKYMQPFAGKALLGTPAVTNGGSPHGLTWLAQFMEACDGCTFDFINVHWYSNVYAGASYFENYVNSTRAIAAGRPIWVTEFGLTSDESYTNVQLGSFLQKVMSWMDQQPDIARYAYFMDAPGVLMDGAGKAISYVGNIYNTYTNKTKQPYLG